MPYLQFNFSRAVFYFADFLGCVDDGGADRALPHQFAVCITPLCGRAYLRLLWTASSLMSRSRSPFSRRASRLCCASCPSPAPASLIQQQRAFDPLFEKGNIWQTCARRDVIALHVPPPAARDERLAFYATHNVGWVRLCYSWTRRRWFSRTASATRRAR